MSLTDYVLGAVDGHRDRPALVDGVSGQTITFGELADGTRRLAAGLSRRGIRQGDVVAIWSPNLPEYAVVFHAVSRMGAILTTANPVYTAEELAFQLRDAGARLLVTTGALLERARAGRRRQRPRDRDRHHRRGRRRALARGDRRRCRSPAGRRSIPATDVVVLPYSSGTTGLPKGVMLTHRNLVANLAQIDAIETADLRAFVGVLPFFHIYGMVVIMNLALLRRADHRHACRASTSRRSCACCRTGRSPSRTSCRRLSWRWPSTRSSTTTTCRTCDGCSRARRRSGPQLTEAVEARLSVRVRQGYGMTEASPATHYTVPGGDRAGKVGPLMPSTEGRIVDPETGADLGPGQAGEVWVRGPQVMKGYLNNPEATARTVDADGWLHTGDIGIVDDDGYLEIVDRLKELIKVKGFQVAPAELEALLLKHPKIADVAVIPVRTTKSGEVPKAIVVVREPMTAEEVMAFVADRWRTTSACATSPLPRPFRSRRRARSCAACWSRRNARRPASPRSSAQRRPVAAQNR